ncbi:MAG: hypothetical protein PVH02_07020 [Desulfobacteraceae bacterium]|jgi:endogenous inhibitor of DNA gyrase (YacG/DUF329 family)
MTKRLSRKGLLMKTSIPCKECDGTMVLTGQEEKSRPFQVLAIILFILGIPMMFALYAGTFIGGALIVTALAIRSHKKKIWKCTECGKLFARA